MSGREKEIKLTSVIFILLQDYNIIFSSIIGSILPKHILNLRINMLFGGNVYHHENENRITESRYITAQKHVWIENVALFAHLQRPTLDGGEFKSIRHNLSLADCHMEKRTKNRH